uniref:ZP domain-containing protein n=1 Tax=Caenorhabditis tropicalis TaxID=1561998 RepID=A0A1I7U5K4_9PELO
MDLPFRGPCNVRRRRNVTPPSISYDVTVIIQHHPLFITSFDKAYRLNCIYRQQESVLQQRINVSCVTDFSLFPEVTYSRDLKSAFTAVRAFRYADQPPICRPMDLGPIKVQYVKHPGGKTEGKAEGKPETLPSRTENTSSEKEKLISTTTYRTTTTERLKRQRDEENTPSPTISSKYQNGYDFPNVESGEGVGQDNTVEIGPTGSQEEYGLEIVKEKKERKKIPVVAEPEKLPKREVFHVETISKTMDNDPLPYPTKASIYQHRTPRSHKIDDFNITLEVESSKLVILENESTDEKTRDSEAVKCEKMDSSGHFFIFTTMGVLQIITLLALITQRFYYKKSIDKLIFSADDRPKI